MATVQEPLFISSRLMAAIKLDDGSTLHIGHDGYSFGRVRYEWIIDNSDGKEIARSEGNGGHIYSGVGSDVDYKEAMGSLLSFLTAAVESYQYAGWEGENANLFSRPVVEWACENSSELEYAHFEFTESD